MIGTWSPGFWWGTIRPGFLRLAINDGLPVTQKTATHHWDRHIFNLTFPRPRLCGENLPLVEESIANTATLGGPIFPTFPYKTWRTVHMRTKTLAQIEGWPAGLPFCRVLSRIYRLGEKRDPGNFLKRICAEMQSGAFWEKNLRNVTVVFHFIFQSWSCSL